MDWTISCNWLDKFYKCYSIGMPTFFQNYIEQGHFEIATNTNSFEIVQFRSYFDILINHTWIIAKSTIWSHCNAKLEIHLKAFINLQTLSMKYSSLKNTSNIAFFLYSDDGIANSFCSYFWNFGKKIVLEEKLNNGL